MFDGSKEGVLLRRYETACGREFHKAIADLMKLRKEAALRPEPEPEEAPLQNEAISEVDDEEQVTSTDPISPRFEAAPAGPPTPFGSPVTPAGPVPAPV